MGGEYSAEQRKAFEPYRIKMEKAINDSEFNVFVTVRDQLINGLRNREPFIEHYIVNYVKMVIKSRQASAEQKFKALLLLKECSKVGVPSMTNYIELKILKRLAALANSRLGPDCLKEYNKAAEAMGSAKFFDLDRECIQNWSQNFKHTNPAFGREEAKLREVKRLPVPAKFWDLPESIVRQREEELSKEVNAKIDTLKLRRNMVTDYIKGEEFFGVNDPSLGALVSDYKEDVQSIKDDAVLRKLQQKTRDEMSLAEKTLVDRFDREVNFHEQFIEVYNSAQNSSEPAAFLRQYQGVHGAFFEDQPLNFATKIGQLDAMQASNVINAIQPNEPHFDYDQPTNRQQNGNVWTDPNIQIDPIEHSNNGVSLAVGRSKPAVSSNAGMLVGGIGSGAQGRPGIDQNNSNISLQNDYPGFINNAQSIPDFNKQSTFGQPQPANLYEQQAGAQANAYGSGLRQSNNNQLSAGVPPSRPVNNVSVNFNQIPPQTTTSYQPDAYLPSQNRIPTSYVANSQEPARVLSPGPQIPTGTLHTSSQNNNPRITPLTSEINKYTSSQQPLAQSQNSNQLPTIPYDPQEEMLLRENDELAREIEMLESNKKNIKESLRKVRPLNSSVHLRTSVLSPRHNLQPQPVPSGLYNVMRNTDLQVNKMNHELRKLEDEYVKVNKDTIIETKDFGGFKHYKTPDGLQLELPARSMSKSLAGKQATRLSTQSQFVNQLHHDINRVLNKPTKHHVRPPMEPVF